MAMLELAEVSNILGGKGVLRGELQDSFDLIELSDRGLSKRALMNLAKYLRLSLGEIAQLLPVSERTVQRRHAAKPFNRAVSEQILHIAEAAARGVEVFGERDRFLSWLNQASTALGGEVPLGLLRTRFGTDMVLQELGRIEHGVIS